MIPLSLLYLLVHMLSNANTKSIPLLLVLFGLEESGVDQSLCTILVNTTS